MSVLILALLAASPEKIVTARQVTTPPRIDGRIEELWSQADSFSDFVQSDPDEGAEPTERTVVFLLQDAGNLYVAWRCHAVNHRPVAQLYGVEEEVTLYIDPMDSKSMAYFFKLYGSGLYHDGLIMDDGRSQDWSWDGVWYSGIRMHEDYFEAEMKIPFKTIRYSEDATEWGINFNRMLAHNREEIFWNDVRVTEGGNMVSRYGRLQGIEPRSQGYYFELYPEGYVRVDEARGEGRRIKPSASLNLKWDLTPQTTFNATVLPDFAQIESDPYSFNISRYPVYLGEQRPFFVEGSEMFRLSGIGEGSFGPLRTFYSRRIGKAVAGEPVPIYSGLKLTTRSNDWSLGALGAYTDRLADSISVIEPRRGFAVLSGRARMPDATNLGALFSGTVADADDYNYALATDWGFQRGPNRGAIEAAFSDKSGTLGWAVNSGFSGFLGNFMTWAEVQVIDDSFSVEDIGYVPWAGLKEFNVSSGPYIRGNGGALRSLQISPGIGVSEQPGSDDLSYGADIGITPNFRNRVGFNVHGWASKIYEADTSFLGRGASASLWMNRLRFDFHCGVNIEHGYNYRQGWIANTCSDWFSLNYYLFGRVLVALNANNWWECDPAGRVVSVTTVARPKVDFRINSKFSFNVYSEMVLLTPGTQFAETELATNRVGFLFSWNFLPKSWVYVAFNNYSVDYGEGLELADRVGAVKLRYLLYF